VGLRDLGELVFIGLGLRDEKDISIRGVEEAEKADFIFAELYTSLLVGFSPSKLEKIIGKEITFLSRHDLEDDNGEVILRKAEKGRVAFLVPGDPLIATTHVALRIGAEKRGIKTKVIHSASIISAAMGLSGLQNYKFGRSVTIPFPRGEIISRTPYDVIAENKARNLHTLCFLDIDAERKRYMKINDALRILLSLENKIRKEIISDRSLAVGISRAGGEDVIVKAGAIKDLLIFNFGDPPHTLIIPSEKLHFVEAEALRVLADAPEWVGKMIK